MGVWKQQDNGDFNVFFFQNLCTTWMRVSSAKVGISMEIPDDPCPKWRPAESKNPRNALAFTHHWCKPDATRFFFWEISFHDLNDFHDLKITWRNQAFHQVMEVTFHTLATQSGDASHGRWDPANHGRRWGARFLKRTSHAFYEGGFPPQNRPSYWS